MPAVRGRTERRLRSPETLSFSWLRPPPPQPSRNPLKTEMRNHRETGLQLSATAPQPWPQPRPATAATVPYRGTVRRRGQFRLLSESQKDPSPAHATTKRVFRSKTDSRWSRRLTDAITAGRSVYRCYTVTSRAVLRTCCVDGKCSLSAVKRTKVPVDGYANCRYVGCK
jgi:hypothetical protein